ncbi:MAG: hypothetical protein ABSG95_06005 [Solirubrobacteraceae bacterium]|jgi:hypothetical protein
MGLGPDRPIRELERALERGDLAMAGAIARDFAREQGRPIGLDMALRLLPLVAAERFDSYDDWSCRWLSRWLNEAPAASIEAAAEIAGALAELPVEPRESLQAIRGALGCSR